MSTLNKKIIAISILLVIGYAGFSALRDSATEKKNESHFEDSNSRISGEKINALLPAQTEGKPVADSTLNSQNKSDPNFEEVELVYGSFVEVKEFRRNCSTTINVLGRDKFDVVESCDRRFEFDHPYATFTDEQLAQIAPTDGEAAFLLAHRKLIVPSPGRQDIEGGLNNVMSAVIRGGGSQAFSLLLDETVFSPYHDLESFILWSSVGQELGLLTEFQEARLSNVLMGATHLDLESISSQSEKMSKLLRSQRLIVTGSEFTD